MTQAVLITGGLGYIGSHTCVEFLNANHKVIIFDNLSNSKIETLDHISKIVFGVDFRDLKDKNLLLFHQVDLLDTTTLNQLFSLYEDQIWGVCHLAGVKSVALSTVEPLEFYRTNVSGSLNLFQAMEDHNITNCIFSSSASVYASQKDKVTEDALTLPCNPYGDTKLAIEGMLANLAKYKNWKVVSLRYFNPMGCHQSGKLGERPTNPHDSNLQIIMAEVACGKRDCLHIFGNTFDTADGTPVRDYVHVVDLARGHLAALSAFKSPGIQFYNLGLGRGYSVLEVVAEWSKLTEKPIPYKIAPPRLGDPGSLIADTARAQTVLNWSASQPLSSMVSDFWKFWQIHQLNPSK